MSVPRSVAVVQKSPLWKQIIANVMNIKVDVLEVEEGTIPWRCYAGSSRMRRISGCRGCGCKIVKVVDTVEPDTELTTKYEERYQQVQENLSEL